MKIILVTGGSRGIGLEICRQLDGLGHRVILGARDPEKGKTAAAGLSVNLVVRQLDVTDDGSINRLAAELGSGFGKLDVLINNAGIGEQAGSRTMEAAHRFRNQLVAKVPATRRLIGALRPFIRKTGLMAGEKGAATRSTEEAQRIMDTNFFGPWRMIQTFLPLLGKSGQARIINVSSGMGSLKGLTGHFPAYSLSKASLNALTILFSNELKGKGIAVNAMCPGWVRSGMGGPDAPRSLEQGADTAVWLATEHDIPTGKFFRDRVEIEW